MSNFTSSTSKFVLEEEDGNTPQDHNENEQNWKTFSIPEIPPLDNSAIEADLAAQYDLNTLFQKMRAVS